LDPIGFNPLAYTEISQPLDPIGFNPLAYTEIIC
jgi:hypothetical protein